MRGVAFSVTRRARGMGRRTFGERPLTLAALLAPRALSPVPPALRHNAAPAPAQRVTVAPPPPIIAVDGGRPTAVALGARRRPEG